MRKYIVIGIVITFLLVFISVRTFFSNQLDFELSKNDSIVPKYDYSFETQCTTKFDGYFTRAGHIISNYYTVCDFNGINNDSILVLSPKILTPIASACYNQKMEIVNNRILVVNFRGIKKYFPDAIRTGIGGPCCGGEQIELSKYGFNLVATLGQACYLKYKIEVLLKDKDLFVNSIYLESKCPSDEKSKSKLLSFKETILLLDKYSYKMIDSLRLVYNI